MKSHLRGLLGLLVGCQTSWVLAATANDPIDTCWWRDNQPGPMTYHRNVGTLYVPRDARAGTLIGRVNMNDFTRNQQGLELRCNNTNGVRLTLNVRNTAPIFSGPLDPIDGEDVTGKIVETGIPGIGARIQLGFPFHDARAVNSFKAIDGRPYVPFEAYWEQPDIISVFTPINSMRNYVTLVKTGPVAPGMHQFDGRELFSGHFTGVGKATSYGLTGTVIQAQCSVSGNPVSADPVQLGQWERSDFTRPGYVTTAVPFQITLSACDTDPSNGDFATAHIKLEGVRGSLPIDPVNNGVFSLTSDSTASGVGIQILKGDGITPLALGSAVPMIPISAGTTVLDFNARFYQTGASQEVRAGSAKGALSFTLTYQ